MMQTADYPATVLLWSSHLAKMAGRSAIQGNEAGFAEALAEFRRAVESFTMELSAVAHTKLSETFELVPDGLEPLLPPLSDADARMHHQASQASLLAFEGEIGAQVVAAVYDGAPDLAGALEGAMASATRVMREVYKMTALMSDGDDEIGFGMLPRVTSTGDRHAVSIDDLIS